MGFTSLAVTTLLMMGHPGTYFDYKVDVAWDMPLASGTLKFPISSGYCPEYTPQISIFQPVNINAPLSASGEMIDLGGNQNTCVRTPTHFECLMPKTSNANTRSFYVRVKSAEGTMSGTTLAAPIFSATSTGWSSVEGTGMAHMVSNAQEQETIELRFSGTTLRYDNLSGLETMVNTVRQELATATNQPIERFHFWNVDTPEGNVILDGYVTAPTDAQWAADNDAMEAPMNGQLFCDGDQRAQDPETGEYSKTNICSASAIAKDLSNQALFETSNLRTVNVGSEMAWTWRLKAGGIVIQCEDGAFRMQCTEPIEEDDDLEDAVMLAAIIIGVCVVISVIFIAKKIRGVRKAESSANGKYAAAAQEA